MILFKYKKLPSSPPKASHRLKANNTLKALITNSDEWTDDHDGDADHVDGGTAVETAKPKLKKPRMYRILINNDDYTPMEFVVHVLENFFSMDRAQATRIMLDVHNKGKGSCGLFTRDTAETKTLQVNNYSKEHNHPLMCSMEVD